MAKIILEGDEFDNYIKVKNFINDGRPFILADGYRLKFIKVYGEAEAIELLYEENRNLRRLLDRK
jgi:hypothetical protein